MNVELASPRNHLEEINMKQDDDFERFDNQFSSGVKKEYDSLQLSHQMTQQTVRVLDSDTITKETQQAVESDGSNVVIVQSILDQSDSDDEEDTLM